MLKLIQKINTKYHYIDFLFVFLLNFFLGLCVFGRTMLQNKGVLTLSNDFNLQQIPLNMLAIKAVHEGNIDWTWNIDLGSSFIGATSFYVLGSPFFYFSLLFPASWYPKLVGWGVILKYAVSGVTSYLYCKQFSSKRYALIGSVLYAFSGYQALNMMFHFQDVIAFFPLLLFGLDNLVQKKRRGVFAFAVFLCSFVNFYFFVSEVVFLIIYFVLRYWMGDWKQYKNIPKCLMEGIMGVGMAMVLFLPSIMFNLENPRVSELLPIKSWFELDRRDVLYILRTFLLPPEDMATLSFVREEDYSSCMLYLPMVACIPTFCYCIKNIRDWLSRSILVYTIMAIVPLFNSVFYFFGSNNYHRWFFMLVLLMCVATQKVLEEKEKYKTALLSLGAAIILVGLFFGTIWWDTHRFQMIFDKEEFLWIFVIGIFGQLWTSMLLFFFKKKENFYFILLASICFFSVLTNFHVCAQYKKLTNMNYMNGNENAIDYEKHILAYVDYPNPDEAYRFSGNDNYRFMVGDISSDACFCSTVNGSIMKLHGEITERRTVFSPYQNNGLNELFSAKYYISDNAEENDKLIDEINYTDGKTDYVYERNNILPIGYMYNSYVLQEELNQYTNEQRRYIMLQSLVISKEDEKQICEYLEHFDLSNAVLDWNTLKDVWTSYHQGVSGDFYREKNRFGSSIEIANPGVIFYSVPYDNGWKVTVNGKEKEIINVNGLMAVALDKGTNKIEFTNKNIYLRLGFGISAISFVIWSTYRKKNMEEIKCQRI